MSDRPAAKAAAVERWRKHCALADLIEVGDERSLEPVRAAIERLTQMYAAAGGDPRELWDGGWRPPGSRTRFEGSADMHSWAQMLGQEKNAPQGLLARAMRSRGRLYDRMRLNSPFNDLPT